MLYLVGLGLNDEHDISLRGLEIVRRCEEVYLEAYTSVLTVPVARLEALYGRPVTVAERDFVESAIEPVLERARTAEIALLVVGDPFGATTHCDVLVRAKALGVQTRVVHNASIMNAIGCCGVQLYRFGEAVSVPFFTDSWKPASFFDKLEANASLGLHSLLLVDIKTREPTLPSLARGRPVYLPPRFMTVRQAVGQVLEIAATRPGSGVGATSRAIGVARVGTESQVCVHGTLGELRSVDFGPPLHSLVLLGAMTEVEEQMLGSFCEEAASARHHTDRELERIDRAAERAARAYETGVIEAEGSGSSESDEEDQH